MFYLIVALVQLLAIFIISRKTTRKIYLAIHRFSKHKQTTAYLYSILFLPGTFIHEMSHFIMALILFVPVGQIELMPEFREHRLKMGSVPIAKTDPVRRFFIGVAPFIFGTTAILGGLYAVTIHQQSNNIFLYLLLIYLIFTVSNTMFSSKKDMEGTAEFLAIVGLIVIFMIAGGVRITLFKNIPNWINEQANFFQLVNIFLLIPLIIDLAVLGIMKKDSQTDY